MDELEKNNIEYFQISKSAKEEYLVLLINKMFKILHLIEEEPKTNFSPRNFIAGQLFEINAANSLFNNELTIIMIKLKGIYSDYDSLSFQEKKKQIFEIKKIIEKIMKELNEIDI